MRGKDDCTATGVFHTLVSDCPRVTLRLGKTQLPRSSEDTPCKLSSWHLPLTLPGAFSLQGLVFTNVAYSYTEKESFCMNLTKRYNFCFTEKKSFPHFRGFGGREAGRCKNGDARPSGVTEGSSGCIRGSWQRLPRPQVSLLMSEELEGLMLVTAGALMVKV